MLDGKAFNERLEMKIGRNTPCPCGRGKKYKKCCGNPFVEQITRPLPPEVIAAFERQQANERIRQQQQGLGHPMISAKVKDQQIVCVGNSNQVALAVAAKECPYV